MRREWLSGRNFICHVQSLWNELCVILDLFPEMSECESLALLEFDASERSADCRGHLVYCDGGKAAARLDDASLQFAIETTGLMINDLMLASDREPDAGRTPSRKGDYTRDAGDGGKVHGS